MIMEALAAPLNAPNCSKVRQALGDLAEYWMNDDCRTQAFKIDRQAWTSRKAIPNEIGCCAPLLALPENSPWCVFLSSGLPLPLQWQKAAGRDDHDPRLPTDLLKVAESVQREVHPDKGPYALRFPAGNAWPDLKELDNSKFPFTFGSAFASLAVGLISAEQNLRPDSAVWCSAAFRDGAFRRVERLEQKISPFLNGFWGLRKFFVALENFYEARELQLAGSPVGTLNPTVNNLDLRQQLAPLLVAAALKPDRKSEFKDKVPYYEFVSEHDREAATAFYNESLVVDVAKNCQKSLPDNITVTHLVTIATDRPEAVQVVVGCLKPKNVLILYTVGMNDNAAVLEKHCRRIAKEMGFEVQCLDSARFGIDRESEHYVAELGAQMKDIIATSLAGIPAEAIAYDIDRGLTVHKVALLEHVVAQNSLLLTIDHRTKTARNGQHFIDPKSAMAIAWRHNRALPSKVS